MNELIPSIEICKLDISNKPKLMTDTYKLNKWLMRIVKAAKKGRLNKIKEENKEFFIEKLKNTIEKYNLDQVNLNLIKDSVYNNNRDMIIKELKALRNIVRSEERRVGKE